MYESLFRTSAFAQASVCAAKSSRYFFVISSCREGADGQMHLTATLPGRCELQTSLYIAHFPVKCQGKIAKPRHGQNIVASSRCASKEVTLHCPAMQPSMSWYALECWVLDATFIWKLAFDSFQLVLRKTVREGTGVGYGFSQFTVQRKKKGPRKTPPDPSQIAKFSPGQQNYCNI